jgi:hypothetical protein
MSEDVMRSGLFLVLSGCTWIGPDENDARFDLDKDGVLWPNDCNDADPEVAPGREEVPYDGVDNDCDGSDLTDVDGDGYDGGDAGTDCDDADPEVSPGASEIPYDGVDNDCDGSDLTDVDGDGYDGGDTGTDCDDADPEVSPGGEEVSGDGIDQDCSGADRPRSCPHNCESLTCLYVDGLLEAEQSSATYPSAMTSVEYLGIGRASFDNLALIVAGEEVLAEPFTSSTGCFAGGTNPNGVYDATIGTDACATPAFDATQETWRAEVDVLAGWSDSPCAHLEFQSASADDDGPLGANWCLDEGGAYLNDGAGVSDYFADSMETESRYRISLCGYDPGPDADGDGWVAQSASGSDCDDGDAAVHPGAEEVIGDKVDQDCDGTADDFLDEDFELASLGDDVSGLSAWTCGGATCISEVSATTAHAGEQSMYLGGGSGEVRWEDSNFGDDFSLSLWFYDQGIEDGAQDFEIKMEGEGGGEDAVGAGWAPACETGFYCILNGSGFETPEPETLAARSVGWHQLTLSVAYTNDHENMALPCIDGVCTGTLSRASAFQALQFNDDGFYAYVDDVMAWGE